MDSVMVTGKETEKDFDSVTERDSDWEKQKPKVTKTERSKMMDLNSD